MKLPVMKVHLRRACLLLLLSAVLLLSAGCGSSPPELKQSSSSLNIVMTPEGELSSELLVLVNTEDEDGDEDVEELYVINDRLQLVWKVQRGSWSVRQNRGIDWNGSERFVMPSGELPPSGSYRLLVADRAGEKAEAEIFVPVIDSMPAEEEFPFIVFADEGESFEIRSPESRNIISLYDAGETLLVSFAATPGTVSVKSLKNGNDILGKYRYIRAGYYSNTYGAGLISGFWDRQSGSKE